MSKSETSFFLKYLPMKVSLVSVETAVLPTYLGSTLRGVIGQALHHNINAYQYLFINRTQNGSQQDTLNPYMIVPPTSGKGTYRPGDELNFHILLLGEAVQYVQPLLNALQEIQNLGLGASRYPFKLVKVVNSSEQRVIWQEGCFYDIAARSVILPWRSLPDVKQLLIRTCTPLRIRRKGELLQTIDFPTIIRNITRRVEAITTRYGGWVDTGEIERVQALSAEVLIVKEELELKNMARYSNRLGEKMDFSGLMGSIQFEGDLTPFVPWLYAAQILHIGRNTTFGMGKIEVEFF